MIILDPREDEVITGTMPYAVLPASDDVEPEGVSASTFSIIQLFEPDIPESFLRALSDVQNGRVVDAERAHNEDPPFNLVQD